jgi:ATP-dependent RNA circularization protein (DNA/RNA ligase family)
MPGVTTRDDKLLSNQETLDFLRNKILIEEKIDGTNVGFSLDDNDVIKIQNRGNYIGPGDHPQFSTIFDWTYNKLQLFRDHLGQRYILFGEWCYLKHSIHYTSLPDWFIGFDVYDKIENKFLSVERRNITFEKIGVYKVNEVAEGTYTRNDLMTLLDNTPSSYGPEHIEGLYFRQDQSDWLLKRAKLVRAEFISGIEAHWKKLALEKNQIG